MDINPRLAAFAAVSDLFADPPPELRRIMFNIADDGDERAIEVIDIFGLERSDDRPRRRISKQQTRCRLNE